RARGEIDALLGEHPINPLQIFALDPARLQRPRGEFEPEHDRIVGDLGNSLHFERQDDLRGDFRAFLLRGEADLLRGPADEPDIRAGLQTKVELYGREVRLRLVTAPSW